MNGYLVFYADKKLEVHAETIYAAYQKGVDHFKPPKSKRHLVHAVLCEKDGIQVTHQVEIP